MAAATAPVASCPAARDETPLPLPLLRSSQHCPRIITIIYDDDGLFCKKLTITQVTSNHISDFARSVFNIF